MKYCLIFLLCFFTSCSLFGPKFHTTTFNYPAAGQQVQVPILVPAGFTSSDQSIDSAGNAGILYNYGGAKFYIVHVRDTARDAIYIDKSANQPLEHPSGGRIYKGMNAEDLFWRELQKGHLRVGYQNVPRRLEVAFDSASNQTARWLFR